MRGFDSGAVCVRSPKAERSAMGVPAAPPPPLTHSPHSFSAQPDSASMAAASTTSGQPSTTCAQNGRTERNMEIFRLRWRQPWQTHGHIQARL